MTHPNAREATTEKSTNHHAGIGIPSNSENKTPFVLSASERGGRKRVSVVTTFNQSRTVAVFGTRAIIKPFA